MRITFASHTAQTGVFRVGSHHLARELSRVGHEVTHISTPTTFAHLSRLRNPTVRSRAKLALWSPVVDENRVRHCEPIIPMPINKVPRVLGALELKWPVKPWRSILGSPVPGRPDSLLIDQPLLGGLIDVLQPVSVVYRPTDAHFDPVMRAAETRVLARSHAVVATSQSVLDEVTRDLPAPVTSLILENGVEFDRFADAHGRASTRRGVVYLGALDRRFDWSALGVMARGFPDVPFTVAGPLPAAVPVELPPNVQLIGPVPYAEAPDLLRHALVGILPLSADPGNRGRSPMKYYEYLASGLSVVASASPTLSVRSAPGVWLYPGRAEAPAALGRALAATAGSNVEGVEYARTFSWTSRARSLVELLEQLR